MKSKCYFDLNGQDESVIRVELIKTDDIRDKVAARFKETLGYESNLALVRILSNRDKSTDPHVLEVRTFGNGQAFDHILDELCNEQKEGLLAYLLHWKENQPKVHLGTGTFAGGVKD